MTDQFFINSLPENTAQLLSLLQEKNPDWLTDAPDAPKYHLGAGEAGVNQNSHGF